MAMFGTCLIREMRLDDIDRVVELEKLIFDSPWSGDLFRFEVGEPERTVYLVAERDGELLAYMGSQLYDQEVHVTNMAVRECSRREGLATAMLLECIRVGIKRGARWLTLEVRRGNEAARRFYAGFGFEELGLRHGYYTDTGEDAIVMATGDILSPGYADLLSRLRARLMSKAGG